MPPSPDHILDSLLVLDAQVGDASALSRLVARWQPRLLAHARTLLASRNDADIADAVQETWLAVVRALPRLNDPDAFAPYLHRILRHKCIERIRRAQLDRRHTTPLTDTTPAPPTNSAPTGATTESADEPDSARLRRAIASLSRGDRELLSLRYTCGLQIDHIADTLSLPLGTVKTHLFRARNELRTILERITHDQPR